MCMYLCECVPTVCVGGGEGANRGQKKVSNIPGGSYRQLLIACSLPEPTVQPRDNFEHIAQAELKYVAILLPQPFTYGCPGRLTGCTLLVVE